MQRFKLINCAVAVLCLFHLGIIGWAAGQIGRQVKNAANRVVRTAVTVVITKQAVRSLPMKILLR